MACGCLQVVAIAVLVPWLTVQAVEPVKELIAEKYLGRWYQMYGDALVDTWFELGSVCVTADYGLNPNGTVSVLNQERIDKPDGQLQVKRGEAITTNEPGKLIVILDDVGFGFPYWVIKLGNMTYGNEGLYQYSVVTDSFGAGLFVLARDVEGFRSTFQTEVLDFLEQNGFRHFFNKPIETLQNKTCQYGPKPKSLNTF